MPSSKKDSAVRGAYEVHGAEAKELSDRAQITPSQAQQLYRMWKRSAKKRVLSLTNAEFYALFDQPETVFTQHARRLITTKRDDELEWEEFFCMVVRYCMMSQMEILEFSFGIFDTDGNGYLEEDEIRALVELLHNADSALTLTAIDEDQDGRINFTEFVRMNTIFPVVLAPAFQFQLRMMVRTFGEATWLKKRLYVDTAGDRMDALAAKHSKFRWDRQRKNVLKEVKRRMGCWRYYCCWQRRIEHITDITGMTLTPAGRWVRVEPPPVSPAVATDDADGAEGVESDADGDGSGDEDAGAEGESDSERPAPLTVQTRPSDAGQSVRSGFASPGAVSVRSGSSARQGPSGGSSSRRRKHKSRVGDEPTMSLSPAMDHHDRMRFYLETYVAQKASPSFQEPQNTSPTSPAKKREAAKQRARLRAGKSATYSKQ